MDFFFDKQYRNYWMGLSILWIVLLHISQDLNNEWFSVFFGKGYLGVDVFFMLSTYGIACSYERNSIYNFYKNRFIRLFPEYLIYLLVLFLFFGNHFTDSLWLLAIYQCTGLACFRNVDVEWYIPTLILLYVTFPLFYRVVRELYNRCGINYSCYRATTPLLWMDVYVLLGSITYYDSVCNSTFVFCNQAER